MIYYKRLIIHELAIPRVSDSIQHDSTAANEGATMQPSIHIVRRPIPAQHILR